MTGVGVVEPYRQVYRKQKTKKTVNRNQPVGCKASTEVGNVGPLGHVCRGMKEKKNEPRGGRPVGCKARTGVDHGGPLGAGTIKQQERGSNGNDRWAGEPERGR